MDNKSKATESCLVITVGFLVAFAINQNPWMFRIALFVGISGLLSEWIAMRIHAGWKFLTNGIGWLNGRVLLTVVFFVFLTPIAWLARKSKASGLQLRRNKAKSTYFTGRNHTYTSGDLENTW